MMEVRIGDRVRFLNDVGGGIVTSVIGKEMVNVETDDGFEVPTLLSNLIVVDSGNSYDKGSKTPSQVVPPKEKAKEKIIAKSEKPSDPWFTERNQLPGKDNQQFYFAIVPEVVGNPTSGNLSMYLLNNCNDTVLFRFALQTKYNFETVHVGTLSPNSKVLLGTIRPEMIADLPVFCFQLIHFRKKAKEFDTIVQREVALSAVKFYKSNTFVNNRFFKTPALLVELHENQLKSELEKLSEHDFKTAVAQKEVSKPAPRPTLPNIDLTEVDLHIQELLDDYSQLTNAEMLKLQMDKFHEEIGKAIQSDVKRIVFIHGVGNGTLKSELRKELQRKYSKYPFQDASFREYGYGATMVILKK